MNTRYRRVAVFVGTAAIAAAAGIGVASKGDATPSSSPNTIQQQQGPGGAPGGMDLSSLADALGVSEARLEEAMRKARPTDRSAGGGPDEMFQTLADELGVSVAKVREAFASTMPQRGDGGAPPSGGAAPAPSGDSSTQTS
jgi:hypothetical protein